VNNTSGDGGPGHVVSGIEAFSESLLVPSAKLFLLLPLLTLVRL
jgi:hypothetical protein